jgi:hypothetical protein
MSNQVRADKQLIIAVMGVGSAAFTSGILGLIEAKTGFALYSLMFWFIVPVGSFLAGCAAASGYYFGAKLFHQKPAGGVAVNMVLASISAYLLVHYIPYYLMEVDGVRVKDTISFWNYLDFDITHTSLRFKRNISTGELGSTFGYIYALIQLIGFSIGGFAVFRWLLDAPFCEKCSKYLSQTNTEERYTSEGEILSQNIQTFAEMLNGRQYLQALEFHADQMGVPESSGHHLRTRITMHKCKTCGINHLDFETSRLEENDWKDITEARMRLWVDYR